jgi:hypothetical protein
MSPAERRQARTISSGLVSLALMRPINALTAALAGSGLRLTLLRD